MRDPFEPLLKSESSTRETLVLELQEHIHLCAGICFTLAKATRQAVERSTQPLPPALSVAVLLSIRLQNDLRCITILAERGFALQALSLTGSALETSLSIATIGNSKALANKWKAHDNLSKSFLANIKEATKTVSKQLSERFGPNTIYERFYIQYRQINWAKHINPLLQAQRGFMLVGNDLVASAGPDKSENGIRDGWVALQTACDSGFLGLLTFMDAHLRKDPPKNLVDKIEWICGKLEVLKENAVKRWGNVDLFEGKWNL